MGVKGLLPLLKSITHERNLDEFAGQTAGVDGYVWLHRAAYQYATQLIMAEEVSENGVKPPPATTVRCRLEQIWRKMAQTFLKYCTTLLNHDVKPFIVFDGGFLPAKGGEEEQRHATRKDKRIAGLDFLNIGERGQAHQAFAGAFDIIPEMALAVINQLRVHKIPFLVAPYEADAQLAYLARNKFIDLVITEDSDMLPYRVPSVLYKLDLSTGCGQHVSLEADWQSVGADSHLSKIFEVRGEGMNAADPNPAFPYDKFLAVCIALGTDYTENTIPKAGPKKICEIVAKAGADPVKIMKRARLDGLEVPDDFVQGFRKAAFCFKFQSVYCPGKKKVVPVGGELPDVGLFQSGEDKEIAEGINGNGKEVFTGWRMDDETARRIAEGAAHPETPYKPLKFVSEPGTGLGDFDCFADHKKNAKTGGSNGVNATESTGNARKGKKKQKEEVEEVVVPPGQMDILSFFQPVELTNKPKEAKGNGDGDSGVKSNNLKSNIAAPGKATVPSLPSFLTAHTAEEKVEPAKAKSAESEEPASPKPRKSKVNLEDDEDESEPAQPPRNQNGLNLSPSKPLPTELKFNNPGASSSAGSLGGLPKTKSLLDSAIFADPTGDSGAGTASTAAGSSGGAAGLDFAAFAFDEGDEGGDEGPAGALDVDFLALLGKGAMSKKKDQEGGEDGAGANGKGEDAANKTGGRSRKRAAAATDSLSPVSKPVTKERATKRQNSRKSAPEEVPGDVKLKRPDVNETSGVDDDKSGTEESADVGPIRSNGISEKSWSLLDSLAFLPS